MKNMNSIPEYVGLTSIQNPKEAELALKIFHIEGFRPGAEHTNMIGCLVSPSTLKNTEPIHSNKPYRQIKNTDYPTSAENGVSSFSRHAKSKRSKSSSSRFRLLKR